MRHRDNAEATARNDAAIVDYRVRLLKDDAAGVIAADRSVVFDFDRARLGIDARVVALDGFTLRNDDAERFLLVVLDSERLLRPRRRRQMHDRQADDRAGGQQDRKSTRLNSSP